MKKKIISLSVAFVLVAIAAIGATFAYLTEDVGSVLNNFAVGNIDIDAVEYVNHTNAAGVEKDIDEGEEADGTYKDYLKVTLDNTGEKKYEYKDILPGDNLQKKVEIKNLNNPAIFAVKVTETLPDEALVGAAWDDTATIDAVAIPAPSSTEVVLLGVDNTTAGTYVFYYYMPKGTVTQEIDLSVEVDENISDRTVLAGYNGAIKVFVAAIQADGFAKLSDAITALETAVSDVAA
ncbi:MAG: hypothetical protein IJN86_06935 [Clostridia bacterium]|nr:hypothetical protein [Clostridia bacterium]